MKQYIMAFDAGTTSSRCIIFDRAGRMVSVGQREFTQYYPREGWVEHDPEEIFRTQTDAAAEALRRAGLRPGDIDSIGITNQRETTIVWDKTTGKPVYNAIVWQCRRTADRCTALLEQGYGPTIQQKTGLLVDAYFSATKIEWILEHISGAKERARRGDLLFGTVDTYLMWRLSGGRIHKTDYSNAARTMLFNLHTLSWDQEILRLFDIPETMLPEVCDTCGVFGETDAGVFGVPIAICSAAGDQHAALFGQACFEKGDMKNTYGTGCFMLMNTGDAPVMHKNGLLTTIAWGMNGHVQYALEGSVFVGGAGVQWLRDELGIISSAAQSEEFAGKVEDTGGVYFVPAFVGLGAPYWDPYARGALLGLTRGSNRYHITRAVLESICYQVWDLAQMMNEAAGTTAAVLKVDGGGSRNNFMMQFQADLLNAKVMRPGCTETTALGAAYLAGLATGFFPNRDVILQNWNAERIFSGKKDSFERDKLLTGWHNAVRRVLTKAT